MIYFPSICMTANKVHISHGGGFWPVSIAVSAAGEAGPTDHRQTLSLSPVSLSQSSTPVRIISVPFIPNHHLRQSRNNRSQGHRLQDAPKQRCQPTGCQQEPTALRLRAWPPCSPGGGRAPLHCLGFVLVPRLRKKGNFLHNSAVSPSQP